MRAPWTRLAFGPWPFVPLPLVILGTLAYLNRSILIAGSSGDSPSEYLRIALALAAQGFVISVLAVIPMALAGNWRHALRWSVNERPLPSRATFLVICAAAAMIFASAQVLSRYLEIDELTGQGVFADIPTAFATSFILTFVFILAISNAVGYVAFRINRQTRLLEAQVHLLERQQRLIVEADQRIRTEVAEALHDDVQGALLRATLRLSRIAESSDDPERAEAVRSVLADLEALRGTGVRAISRRLAPPLSTVGLIGALEDLAGTYRGTLEVEVTIDGASERSVSAMPSERQLAAYRIVEQALLNATGHGKAERVRITVDCRDETCLIDVVDDGAGLAADPQAGHGTAIIDAWMAIVKGEWSLEPNDPSGTRLRAILHRP